MALGYTHLLAAGDTTNASSYTTASVTAAAGDILVVGVIETAATTGASTVTGAGLAFTKAAESLVSGQLVAWHWALVPGGGFTGTLTIAFTSPTTPSGAAWEIGTLQGANTTTPFNTTNKSTGAGTATSFSGSLPQAPVAGSDVLTILYHAAAETATAATGFTLEGSATYATPNAGLAAFFGVNGLSVGASWTSNVGFRALAIEVIAAAASLARSDSGSGADFKVGMGLASSESGGGSETDTETGHLSSSESGSGAAVSAVHGKFVKSETATGSETRALAATVASSESGAGTAIGGAHRPITGSDVGGAAIDFSSLLVPPVYSVAGLTVRPRQRGLGRVVWMLDDGIRSMPIERFDSWEAIEEVPGGYMSANGRVLGGTVRNHYPDETKLMAWLEESGEDIFGGRLLGDPVRIGDGVAELTAEGWAHLLDDARAFLGAATDYSLFFPMSSDPANLTAGFLSQNEGVFQVTTDGKLQWQWDKGADLNTSDNAGLAEWTQGATISSFAFHLSMKGPRDYVDLLIFRRTGPRGNISVAPGATPDFKITLDSAFWSAHGGDSQAGTDLDIDLTSFGDGGVNDELIIVIQINASATPLAADWVRITDPWTRGVARSNTMSAADLFLAVFGAAGIRVDEMDQVLDNVLPLYVASDAAAEPILQANLLTDTYYTVLGARTPRFRAGYWTTHQFSVTDREATFTPTWAPRFGRVRVPFQYANSSAQGYAEATAVGSDVSSRMVQFPALNPLPDPSTAASMAQLAANYLNTHRGGGTGSFSTILDANGVRRSGYVARTGATLSHVNAPFPVRITYLRRTGDTVEWIADPGLGILNTLFARFVQSQAAKLGAPSDSFQGLSI